MFNLFSPLQSKIIIVCQTREKRKVATIKWWLAPLYKCSTFIMNNSYLFVLLHAYGFSDNFHTSVAGDGLLDFGSNEFSRFCPGAVLKVVWNLINVTLGQFKKRSQLEGNPPSPLSKHPQSSKVSFISVSVRQTSQLNLITEKVGFQNNIS